MVLSGFANDRFSTNFVTLNVYSTAGLCTMIGSWLFKMFFTLSLHNDLVVCGSPNLIELCHSLVYSIQFNVQFYGCLEDSLFATGIFGTMVHLCQKI